MVKKVLKINGMHCTSCSLVIEGELDDIGVLAKAHYAQQLVEVQFDPAKVSEKQIISTIEKQGYVVLQA